MAGEHAAPGIEQHNGLGAGGNLSVQIQCDAARQQIQQFVECRRFAVKQTFDQSEFLAGAALDHVTGQRPGAAGETDERHAAGEFAADQAHRIQHVAQFRFRVGHCQFRHCGGIPHRPFEGRAFAFHEMQAQTHGRGDGEDVGEQNRRVQRKAIDGLQRDFAGQFRCAHELDETAGAGTGFAVLGEVAARLAHDPYGRARRGFAQERTQEQIVFEYGLRHSPHPSLLTPHSYGG